MILLLLADRNCYRPEPRAGLPMQCFAESEISIPSIHIPYRLLLRIILRRKRDFVSKKNTSGKARRVRVVLAPDAR